LVNELILPKIRLAISSQWTTRDFQPVINLMDSLKGLVSAEVYASMLSQLVAPKLRQEIQRWNPRTDAVAIHTWLLPWRGILSDEELQPMYAAIRYKLAFVLQDWHASDSSALAIIAPWNGVWSDSDLQTFITRNIIPKLQMSLQKDLVVNPHKQLLEPIRWVFAWANVAAPRLLVHVLCGFFFPKWFHALFQWLSSAPDFEEVSRWYLGWRDLFPANLREHALVKQMLSRGLDLMNAAIEEKPLAPLMESINSAVQSALSSPALAAPGAAPAPPSFVPQAERETKAKPMAKETKAPVMPGVESEDLSFKDVVQRFAELNSIEFVPNVKRGLKDGKQIYSFGKLNVYIDGQAIYAFLPDASGVSSWRPISLQEMAEKARS